MLSELFTSLEFDDEVPTELPICKAEDFHPLFHSKNWFLNQPDSELSETLAHRAFQAYHVGHFQRAFELFQAMLAEGGHNRVHKVGIYESIIRSAIKLTPLPTEIGQFLKSYCNIATEYGDQLQYWASAALVHRNFPSRTCDYLKTVILLCSTVDSPDHWALFGQNEHISVGPNFQLAYRTRMMALLDHNMDFASGFVAERLKTRRKAIEEEVESMGETEERKSLAKTRMITDLLRSGQLRELGDDIRRPAHDSRCKVGTYKTPQACSTIIGDFLNRFEWMFVGMSIL